MSKRRDAVDTVDVATHQLHRWQAEGYGVADLETRVDYSDTELTGGVRLPVEVFVTVRLIPIR